MARRETLYEKRRFKERPRPGDWRSAFTRDKARIIHGAAFRRLQGKTQVMGAGEGDFHRTRLTHSLEVAQIGQGLFDGVTKRDEVPKKLEQLLIDSHDLIVAACFAHDLGHPPFGHGGERALHEKMRDCGGFEGNAQTIRILDKLEKYVPQRGINPSRRTLLSVLKYPVNFSAYPDAQQKDAKPPKCYYDLHQEAIRWAMEIFRRDEISNFTRLEEIDGKQKPIHMTLDASIMECADDIAYCTHDLEDIVARKLVSKEELLDKVKAIFDDHVFDNGTDKLRRRHFQILFKETHKRKKFIGKLVNFLMNSTYIKQFPEFNHPLLRYRLKIKDEILPLVEFLKIKLTYEMVVKKPGVRMLEKKGEMLIKKLFTEFSTKPAEFIHNWDEDDPDDPKRKICDYLAGMTDSYATKIYHRLFTPGIGTSVDEL